MEAKLGNYVRTGRHNYRGRIYRKDHRLVSEDMDWFKAQVPEIPEEEIDKPWYSILVHEHGAIYVPESDIVEIEAPYKLINAWESFYF